MGTTVGGRGSHLPRYRYRNHIILRSEDSQEDRLLICLKIGVGIRVESMGVEFGANCFE
jgi:hypothetical protein